MQTRYDQQNPPALKRLLEQGVVLKPFPDDIMLAAQKASTEVLEEQASKDAGYRKIYDHFKKARAEMFRWFGTAELAYAAFAFPKET
jgi:TRAP-type mannitol/chloroaromatic compound transport system substrate-binding protein